FSIQYGPLRDLHSKYSKRNFSVIGVPSDDFHQEPDDNTKIQRVCKESWLVNFPMTSKTHIRGKDAHPFFNWATKEGGFFSAPKWNFHKYLIAPNGTLVDWYLPSTSPMSRKIVGKIEGLLG
ncbi:MAG: glutathione peroxidase, partial [Alphaproteobacteria bacterium]|nr:glutathione peroxidase [Alphaproteobacteria bacterium]